jgi:hypothetical protein
MQVLLLRLKQVILRISRLGSCKSDGAVRVRAWIVSPGGQGSRGSALAKAGMELCGIVGKRLKHSRRSDKCPLRSNGWIDKIGRQKANPLRQSKFCRSDFVGIYGTHTFTQLWRESRRWKPRPRTPLNPPVIPVIGPHSGADKSRGSCPSTD